MEKLISCAVFYTNKKQFLAVHPTNHSPTYWDLPKGINEQTESFEETAVREFNEEVGILLNKNSLQKLGLFKLHEDKDIIIYIYVVPELPSINSMKCSSMTDAYGKLIEEIDKYKYFNINEFRKLRKELHKHYYRIIDKLGIELN